MNISSNSFCPCNSGKKYKRCCKAFVDDGLKAPNALMLMRSRYTAHVLANVNYIIETTHTSNPSFQENKEAWSAELLDYCKQTNFLNLQVLSFNEKTNEAFVTFVVYFKQNGQQMSFKERSLFVKENNCWLYASGEFLC